MCKIELPLQKISNTNTLFVMKINRNIDGNQAFRFIDLLNEVEDIKSDLRVKEEILARNKYHVFLNAVNNEIALDSVVKIDATNHEYKIMGTDVFIHTDDNKNKYFEPYVRVVRVKKGTKQLIDAYRSYNNPLVYAKSIPAHHINKIITK